jgi:UDP-2,3-diacylglucosamine hydrolase
LTVTRYFISDAHLFPQPEEHPGRERLLSFLDYLSSSREIGELWILGDLFDFWFEYGSVVPAGYSDCLASLKKLSRRLWKVNVIPGNHDWWLGKHFEEAAGATVHRSSTVELRQGDLRMVLAHGDGLGPGDIGYKMLRPVLRSGISSFLFRLIHPTVGFFLARRFSDTSRRILRREQDSIPEGLQRWVRDRFRDGVNIVITGHTHLDTIVETEKCIHVSLGDWLTRFTYCRIDGSSGQPELLTYHQRRDDQTAES